MSNLSLNTLVTRNKLTGSNYLDWLHNLRLVFREIKIEYVLDTPIPIVPDQNSLEYVMFDMAAYHKHLDDANNGQVFMLASLTMELQRQHKHMKPYQMLENLKSLYAPQAQTMVYELLRDLFRCRLHDESKVSDHVLKMIALIEKLAVVGTKLQDRFSVNLILQSLPPSFENFIVNYNTNNMNADIHELHNMLKNYGSQTQTQTRITDYELLRDLFNCRLHDESNVSDHVLKMIGLIEVLARRGIELQDHVSVNLILQSLPNSFDNFVVNYNTDNNRGDIFELYNMLETYELYDSGREKKQERGEDDSTLATLNPGGGVRKKTKTMNDVCQFCKEKGHWKRDCQLFEDISMTFL